MSTLFEIDPDLITNEARWPELQALIKSLTAGREWPRPRRNSFKILTCNSPTLEELRAQWANEPRFCDVCIKVSRDLALFSMPRSTTPVDSRQFIEWQFNFADLGDAAAKGCQFCGFIAQQFFNNTISSKIWGLAGDKVAVAVARLRKLCEKYPDTWFKFIVQPVDYNVETQKYGKLKFEVTNSSLSQLKERESAINEVLGTRRDITLEIYATPGDLSTKSLSYLPINTDPGSDDTFVEVQGWVEDCMSNHDGCLKPTPGMFPTRIVEILDNDQLRITMGDGLVGHYSALSYCWGNPQEFATTTESISAMQDGFNITALPLTLQNAVRVIQKLGLRYIWVDSLCILQDSPADKVHEIPSMATYFKNAKVTIAASCKTCDSGFLEPRGVCTDHTDSSIPMDLLEMRLLLPDEKAGMMLFREENPYRMSDEPISQRGWTFQERVLSPRMLFYGQRVIWQCQERQMSSGGFEDWSGDFKTMGNRKISLALRSGTGDLVKPSEEDTISQGPTSSSPPDKIKHPSTTLSSSLLETWHAAVQEYSHRRLTLPEDKLPAIAGLASEIHNLMDAGQPDNDAYLAGLWRSNILRDLLWSTYPTMVLTRPPAWRAPTWSWASVDNVVEYARLRPTEISKAVARVLSCYVQAKETGIPFGEVKSAELIVRAPVLRPPKELVEGLVRRENHLERTAPEFGARWWEETLDLTERGIGEDAGGIGWEAPEGSVLAVLFLTVSQGEKTEKKNENETERPADDKEKVERATAEPQEIGVTKQTPADAEREDKGQIKFTCLVLGPVDDDKYERLGALSFTIPGGQELRVPLDDLTIV